MHRLRVRRGPFRRRRVVGLRRAVDLRRHASDARGDRHRRFLRVSRACSRRFAGWLCARFTPPELGSNGWRWPLRRGRSPSGCAAGCCPDSAGCRSAMRRLGTPLAGFAPYGGVFLVTLAVAAHRGVAACYAMQSHPKRAAALAVAARGRRDRRPASGRCRVVDARMDARRRRSDRGQSGAGQHRAGTQIRSSLSRQHAARSTPICRDARRDG